MKLYIYTTADKYELPMAVADTIDKLSRMTGINKATISKGLRRDRAGLKTRYHRIEVED